MNLTGRLVRACHVTDDERHEMFSLMATYYDNVDRATFYDDLNEKDWVILLQDPIQHVVRGFSTQMLLSVDIGQHPVRALFSGDTIVHSDYWSRNPLAQVWGRFALSLIDDTRNASLVWFLTTKGYKTYRFLPVFFHDFYPRYDTITPAWAADWIAALARSKYPGGYDPQHGVLRWGSSACQLRNGVAEVTEGRLRDPHIEYFTQRNPGHARGDELCCLAPLTRHNFTRAAYRVIGTQAPVAVV